MASESEFPPGLDSLGIEHAPQVALTPPMSPRSPSEGARQMRVERRQSRVARAAVSSASAALTDAISTSEPPTATDPSAVSEPATPKPDSAPKVDPRMASQCLRVLENFAAGKKGWDMFYPNGYTEFMDKAAEIAEELHSRGCTREVAQRFSVLLLYDLVILLDDSSSMEYAEGGRRKEKLRDVLSAIAEIYGLAREQGIVSVRSLNGPRGRKDVTLDKVAGVHSKIVYGGVTMIGTQLQNKILNPFVLSKARMEKPLLTIIITDGNVEGERKGLLEQNIDKCLSTLQKDVNKTEDAVAFMFARLGNDEGAKTLIQELDDHETLGKWIDCLPGELEYLDEISRKGEATYWEVIEKLMLGALFPEIDDQDEPEPENYLAFKPIEVEVSDDDDDD